MDTYMCNKDLRMSSSGTLAFEEGKVYKGKSDRNDPHRTLIYGGNFKTKDIGHGVTKGAWLDHFTKVDPDTLEEYEDD